jgi:hypothetical protein
MSTFDCASIYQALKTCKSDEVIPPPSSFVYCFHSFSVSIYSLVAQQKTLGFLAAAEAPPSEAVIPIGADDVFLQMQRMFSSKF